MQIFRINRSLFYCTNKDYTDIEKDSKRSQGPVNIPKNVELLSSAPNTITVFWRNDFHKKFVVSAYLVEKMTSSQLLQLMKAKGTTTKQFTIAQSTFGFFCQFCVTGK